MKRIVSFILFFVLFLSSTSHALEADQYQIWKHLSLPDATLAANDNLNHYLTQYLSEHINARHNKTECPSVASGFMFYVRPHFFLDRFKRDLIGSDSVEMYPARSNMFRDYNNSIYRGPVWPFVMPVSQTIRINNVFTGTDKIDHFLSSARRYFHVYKDAIKDGKTSDEAKMAAIRYGLGAMQEKGILGYMTSGAFSFADLEANYQGMQMAVDMCYGDKPILKEINGDWSVARPINLRDYFNPMWDEAFNNSYFVFYRWAGVKKVLKKEYCDMARTPEIQKLWKDYNARLKPSLNTDYLRGLMSVGKVPDPRSQSLANFCGFEKGVMEGPWVWGK